MNKEELIKTIKENKDLDIVVMASTDELSDEYGSLLMENLRVEVTDIYNSPQEEIIYFDKDEVVDEIRDYFADDEEYEKICKEKAKDYFYKRAIVIWARNWGVLLWLVIMNF